MEQFPKFEVSDEELSDIELSDESSSDESTNELFDDLLKYVPAKPLDINVFTSYIFSRKNWTLCRQTLFDIGTCYYMYPNIQISYWKNTQGWTCFRIEHSIWSNHLVYKINIPENFSITEKNKNSIENFCENIEKILSETNSDKIINVPKLNCLEFTYKWA